MVKLQPMPFDSVLIANRGEIACRVIRSAKAMGLKTIAVYSDADAGAPHVKMADQAVNIGPAPAAESYLNASKILDAANAVNAGSIHPGYGFLSENADFAKACENAGIVFIGPKPDAIELMGDKAKAKRRMINAGVPCVPGYQDEDQDDKTLIAAATEIGFPIMVKAAAGGGGRGMRLVNSAKDLPNAIKDARSEALNAFGSGELILERAVQNPRHVEIQIFADQQGNTIHLGERDCSVQRRHQKVLEEAPCPVMTNELRAAMGRAAVKAAKDIGYVGAGTVEFLLDGSGEFFFLEMNTRLQVEHPVTEMITGLDLVELQIRTAQGAALEMSQDDINLSGHAIEARLYAEDVEQDFLPATGSIDLWLPARGDGIRVDSGVETGGEVSPFYDPMIAKIIAHGGTREEARLKLIDALKDTALFGVKTNKTFLIDALSHSDFAAGDATTSFIEKNFNTALLNTNEISTSDAICAALIQYECERASALNAAFGISSELLNWSSASKISTPYAYALEESVIEISITPQSITHYLAETGDAKFQISVLSRNENHLHLSIDGHRIFIYFNRPSLARIQVSIDGRDFDLVNLNAVIASSVDATGAGAVLAPMHGSLLEVFVKPNDPVVKGQRLAILEAMKMQHEILAEIDGKIETVHVQAGTQIAADTLMIEIESEGAE